MPPSVSQRVSIAWGNEKPYEDTDTLVLVGERTYVDVRIANKDGSLDWATAGVKKWVHRKGEKPRARFIPFISSRAPPPSNATTTNNTAMPALVDEGTFTDLPNGDQLETGEMLDPNDGRVKPYREIWRDLPLAAPPSSSSSSTNAAAGGNNKVPVAFLRREDGRAAVARIGGWQLGVARLSNGEYGVWKMELIGGVDGEWKTVVSIGGPELNVLAPPLDVLTCLKSSLLLKPAHVLDPRGVPWVVMECYEHPV